MLLYLDDDTVRASLVARLRRAHHQVILPKDIGLSGASDARHLIHCIRNSLTILTRNRDDFMELHELIRAAVGQHAGILVICQDNDPTRDMTDRGIVNAIAKLEASGIPMANEFHVLNHWR